MISIRITGLEKLQKSFAKSPEFMKDRVEVALGKSISMVEAESKRRTPVDTGLLRSSIGGVKGFKWVRGFRASVGTNVKYAAAVHDGHGRHNVGERKFMDKGVKASKTFIRNQIRGALKDLSKFITR